MAAIPFAVPYAPNNVPTILLGTEPTQALQDLTRFLHEELDRISEAMRFVPVQAAYGALLVAPGPAPNQPLPKGVPTPLNGFNNFAPNQPNRVTAVVIAVADSLQVLEGGVYWVQAQVTATIDTGTSYAITVAVNGVLSEIFGSVQAGNQSTLITLTFYGLVELSPGDILTLVAVATANPAGPFTFIMESATFSTVRISELHGRDAAATP